MSDDDFDFGSPELERQPEAAIEMAASVTEDMITDTEAHASAIRLLQDALDLDPKNPAIQLKLGMYMRALKWVEKAIPHLQRACELLPDSVLAKTEYARALHLLADKTDNRKDFERAAEVYVQTLALEQDPFTIMSYMRVLVILSDAVAARELYGQSINEFPDDPWVNYAAALYHYVTDQKERAAHYIEQSLANAGDNQSVLKKATALQKKIMEHIERDAQAAMQPGANENAPDGP